MLSWLISTQLHVRPSNSPIRREQAKARLIAKERNGSSLYGVSTWAPSTFDGHKALIDNYIKPIIGEVKLNDISPRMMTKFYKDLQTVKAVPRSPVSI